jgi:hypothetical protein
MVWRFYSTYDSLVDIYCLHRGNWCRKWIWKRKQVFLRTCFQAQWLSSPFRSSQSENCVGCRKWQYGKFSFGLQFVNLSFQMKTARRHMMTEYLEMWEYQFVAFHSFLDALVTICNNMGDNNQKYCVIICGKGYGFILWLFSINHCVYYLDMPLMLRHWIVCKS